MVKEQVIQLVHRYLTSHQPKDFTIEVLDEAVRNEGNWWYVPVRTKEAEPRTYEYYVILSDIEAELKQKEQVDVLLVPAA